jgi:hypothetical protein
MNYEEAQKTASQMMRNRLDHPFYYAAREYCDRNNMAREEQLLSVMHDMSHKAFIEQSKPYMDIKVKYANLGLEVPDAVAKPLDELIANIAKRCGLESPQ